MFNFMMELRFDNSKAFMEENKARYLSVMKAPYCALIEDMHDAMLRIDERMEVRPSKVLSRLHRDTRFSHNKEPYRDHHWIAFRRAGIPRDQAPMFWMEVRLEEISWGLGFWGENRPAMDIIRKRILAFPGDFINYEKLLKRHDFVLQGQDFKRLKIPDDLHPKLEAWYPKKELFFVKRHIDPKWIYEADFKTKLIQDFTALAPLYKLMQGSYEIAMLGEVEHGL